MYVFPCVQRVPTILIHGPTPYHWSSRCSAATWRQSGKHGLTENDVNVHHNPWHLWRRAFREALTWARSNGRTINYDCTTKLRTATSNDGKNFSKKLGNEWNNLVSITFYTVTTVCATIMNEIRGGADKSLARPTSRCRWTESIVSLERGVCSCSELQVFSCYRGWKEACKATRAISTTSRREPS